VQAASSSRRTLILSRRARSAHRTLLLTNRPSPLRRRVARPRNPLPAIQPTAIAHEIPLVLATSAGLLPYTVPRKRDTGIDEITQIASSINRLVARVETSHAALEAFTADASHELRTPLTHLRAQAQWALDERRTVEEMREALDAIGGEVDRTSKLVEDLLLLARGDNHALAVRREVFDVAETACEVTEIAQAMATGRDITVTNEIAASVHVDGDPGYTRQVLLNLTANAVRHTERGSVTISARRRGDAVDIAVADTGDGIPPEDLPLIFDRFYRVEKSRSRAHGGVGLGLSIVRMLTELQGGTVTVESELGRGSTFTVQLPAAPILPNS